MALEVKGSIPFTHPKQNIGLSSSGKTQHFDCCIRRFESCQPSHSFYQLIKSAAVLKLLKRIGFMSARRSMQKLNMTH